MAESFTAGEDLGFVALSLPTGGSVWLAASSIYALETHPEEEFTTVKTMGETLGVSESPEAVFVAMQALQTDSQDRAVRKQRADAVDHVVRWKIPVELFKHDPVKMYESDEMVPLLQEAGHPVKGPAGSDEPDEPANTMQFPRVSAIPSDFGAHPDDGTFATEWSKEESLSSAITLGEYIRKRRLERPEETFEQALEDDIGYDMNDALDRARKRAEGREE